MTLEEANKIVTVDINYSALGWQWRIDTHKPYGSILGYDRYNSPEGALEELKSFLRYFTENVLKNGDTIRAYVNKHNPNKKENDN